MPSPSTPHKPFLVSSIPNTAGSSGLLPTKKESGSSLIKIWTKSLTLLQGEMQTRNCCQCLR